MTTQPSSPPMIPSNEADSTQLGLARAQGDAYGRALAAMRAESGVSVKRAGDYLVAFGQERAEGLFGYENGQMVWREPPAEANAHFAVAIADSADGRFVPALDITLMILDGQGEQVLRTGLPFLWHPFLHRYGINARLPGPGPYLVRVVIEPPQFLRHDPINGRRYGRQVSVEFTGQRFTAGCKPSRNVRPRSGVTPIASGGGTRS